MLNLVSMTMVDSYVGAGHHLRPQMFFTHDLCFILALKTFILEKQTQLTWDTSLGGELSTKSLTW